MPLRETVQVLAYLAMAVASAVQVAITLYKWFNRHPEAEIQQLSNVTEETEKTLTELSDSLIRIGNHAAETDVKLTVLTKKVEELQKQLEEYKADITEVSIIKQAENKKNRKAFKQ